MRGGCGISAALHTALQCSKRGTLRRMADGDEYKVPATIDDPAILTEISERLASIGLPAVH